MPSILNLKFKGNKSFVAFSNLDDAESLTKTWKVCTKVASYLEQGQRLENLSWRLWHLQNLIVDTDHARSKRKFKKLSKCMGEKLDQEKGRSVEVLEAPDFKRNSSTDMIRQRAVDKERSREASQNSKPGIIKQTQFTFSVDQPTSADNFPVKKPDLEASPEIKRQRNAQRSASGDEADEVGVDDADNKDPPLTQRGRTSLVSEPSLSQQPQYLRFPSFFSSDFDPSALLYPAPTITTRMNYGEGFNSAGFSDGFSIVRPTIELPLDELLKNVDLAASPGALSFAGSTSNSNPRNGDNQDPQYSHQQQGLVMQSALRRMFVSNRSTSSTPSHGSDHNSSDDDNEESDINLMSSNNLVNVPPISQVVRGVLPQTISPSEVGIVYDTRAKTPTGRPTSTFQTQVTQAAHSSGPGASINSASGPLSSTISYSTYNDGYSMSSVTPPFWAGSSLIPFW